MDRRATGLPLLLGLLVACTPEGGDQTSSGGPSRAGAGPQTTDPDAGDAAAHLDVRVVSFNVRWDGFDDGPNAWQHRRHLAASVLEELEADSIGLQEPSPRQVADLLDALPGMQAYTYEETSQPILYDAGRFRLGEAGGLLLFEGTDLPGSRRTCTWVRLIERQSGRAYYHYNVHLDHRSRSSRRESARWLLAGIESRSSPDPFVVTGDLNAGERSPTLELLRGERRAPGADSVRLQLVDSLRVVHPTSQGVATAAGFDGGRAGRKIDYVLVAPETEVLDARIVRRERDGRYPSDHYPVTATLRFRR